MENFTQIIEKYEDLFLVHFAEAYAYYPNMRKELNRLYDDNKYLAYQLAKSTSIYDHDLFKHGDLEKEIYCKRSLGLLVLSNKNQTIQKELIKLIKENRPKLYSAYKRNNTFKILTYLVNLQANEIPAIYKSDVFLGLYLYFCDLKKNNNDFLDIEVSSSDGRLAFIQYAIEVIKLSNNSNAFINNKEKLVSDNHDQIRGIIDRITQNYGEVNCFEDIYRLSDETINKYQTILSFIFDLEKLSIRNIMNSIKLDSDDINEIILAYRLVYKDKNLERSMNVLINGIIIKTLIKAYKKVKISYFENNRETLYLNLEEKDNKIQNLKSENEKLAVNLNMIESKLSSFEKDKSNQINKINSKNQEEISMLLKQIKKYELAINKHNEDITELNKLRELLFDIDRGNESKEANKNLATYLNEKKVLIVGGHQDWRLKISTKYSNILTMDGLKENFEKQILLEMDIVLFYTGYMNHKTYYKIIDYIRKNKISFGYLKNVNIDLVENEIINALTNLQSQK